MNVKKTKRINVETMVGDTKRRLGRVWATFIETCLFYFIKLCRLIIRYHACMFILVRYEGSGKELANHGDMTTE